MTVGAERLAVNPGLGNSVGGLALGQAHELADDGGGSDLDENNMVEADLVVGVLESKNTLDLMGLDHSLEDIADLEHLTVGERTTSTVGSRDPVSDGQDTTEVVGRVTPLSSEPAVVVVEPADHGADVEGTVHRVELVGSSRDTGAIGDRGAWNNWAEQLGALSELEALETAAKSVEEDPASSVKLLSLLARSVFLAERYGLVEYMEGH